MRTWTFQSAGSLLFGRNAVDQLPDVARGLTSCAFDDDEWPLDRARRAHLAALADFDAAGAVFVSHDRADLGNPAVAALRARGIPILTWTIRAPDQEAAARHVADNITFEGYAPRIPG